MEDKSSLCNQGPQDSVALPPKSGLTGQFRLVRRVSVSFRCGDDGAQSIRDVQAEYRHPSARDGLTAQGQRSTALIGDPQRAMFGRKAQPLGILERAILVTSAGVVRPRPRWISCWRRHPRWASAEHRGQRGRGLRGGADHVAGSVGLGDRA